VEDYKSEEMECQDEQPRRVIMVPVQFGVAQNLTLIDITIS
jgi:hypothetical protein